MAILALQLLDSADAAYVSTLGPDGRPRTRAMLNLRNRVQYPGLLTLPGQGGFEVWFTTNTSSGKMADLAGNRAVSSYYCRPAEWRGLMLGGDMEIVTDRDARHRVWQEGWALYYPQGPDDPDYTVLRLRPSEIRYYHQLQSAVLEG